MRKILVFFVLVTFTVIRLSASVNDDLSRIYHLMQTDREAAKELIFDLKSSNDMLDNQLWMVRSNFYLAYMHKLDNEFGKSVIYYLEAIRYSKKASYDGIVQERISLYKNIANIFQRFKAHDLATKYNNEALELAQLSKNQNELIGIKLNQSRNLRANGEFDKAIELFLTAHSLAKEDRILNEIGITYMLKEDWSNAELYFTKLINQESTAHIYRAKALHNLGEIDFLNGSLEDARNKLIESIKIKESIDIADNSSLFISYKTIGEYSLLTNSLEEAGIFLNKAENLLAQFTPSIDHFNVYQLLSDYHYRLRNGVKAQYYSSLYSTELETYIKLQEEIQETDKKYNMDLITKRYFDEIAKQEKITSILFYSRLTSGGLLALLLFVIAYNRFEKLKVKRSIERQLIQLEMID